MAQDLNEIPQTQLGQSVTLRTTNSDDAIVGTTIANVTTSQITVEVYINDGSNDIHIVKDAPILGSSLKFLMVLRLSWLVVMR